MAMVVLSWLLAIPMLGLASGMRTITPIAAICWFAWLGELPVANTWAFWTAKPASVVVFTLLALGEYVGDKLPKAPARIELFPLLARLVFGGMVGAIIATTLNGSDLEGIILGVINAFLGAFGGYFVRRVIVERTGWPDFRVALGEDAVCLSATLMALMIVDAAT